MTIVLMCLKIKIDLKLRTDFEKYFLCTALQSRKRSVSFSHQKKYSRNCTSDLIYICFVVTNIAEIKKNTRTFSSDIPLVKIRDPHNFWSLKQTTAQVGVKYKKSITTINLNL